jgi:hypothetical protein
MNAWLQFQSEKSASSRLPCLMKPIIEERNTNPDLEHTFPYTHSKACPLHLLQCDDPYRRFITTRGKADLRSPLISCTGSDKSEAEHLDFAAHVGYFPASPQGLRPYIISLPTVKIKALGIKTNHQADLLLEIWSLVRTILSRSFWVRELGRDGRRNYHSSKCISPEL